jgi:hypothetical protein
MRVVRIGLGLVLIAVTFVGWWRFEQHVFDQRLADAVSLSVAAGLLAALAGLAVWDARPDRSTGPLLTIAGTAVVLSAFAWFTGSSLEPTAWVTWACLPLVGAHLLLAHPDGVSRRLRPAVLVACWLVPAALGLVTLAFADTWRPSRLFDHIIESPPPLTIADRPDLAHFASIMRWLWVATVAVAVSGFALRRARRARGAVRSSLLPVAWAGAGWALAQVLALPSAIAGADVRGSVPKQEVLRLIGTVLPSVTVLVLGCTVVWVELVRPRLDPSRDGHIRLSGAALPTGEVLRRELARTVGDPALRIAYAAPSGAWVGADGGPITLRDDRDRAVTTLTRGGELVAAVEHDVGLRAAPDLLAVATTMAGLAIENDRLRALDAAQLEAARASGARLLAAGERAREDLEMTVAGGPAARLTDLAQLARGGAVAVAVQHGLRDVVEEIRSLSRGFAPPELAQDGLAAALPDAVVVPARRFARPVELTAYLVAVGQPGARIDDEGDRLVLHVTGPLAEGVADRITALEGTITPEADGCVVTLPVER